MPSSEMRQEEQCLRGLAEVTGQLAALAAMTVNELRVRFEELYGYPTSCRNKENLRKRVAWKIQADAEGGLSARAQARIEELAPLALARWQPRRVRAAPPDEPGGRPVAGTAAASPGDACSGLTPRRRPRRHTPRRDARLPRPGTVLVRLHQGVEHQVTVMAQGFVYAGQRYASLSKVARVITGTHWSGFLFFRAALAAARAASDATE